jgi:hypothetical protein
VPNLKISERGIVPHLVYFDTSKLGRAGSFELPWPQDSSLICILRASMYSRRGGKAVPGGPLPL